MAESMVTKVEMRAAVKRQIKNVPRKKNDKCAGVFEGGISVAMLVIASLVAHRATMVDASRRDDALLKAALLFLLTGVLYWLTAISTMPLIWTKTAATTAHLRGSVFYVSEVIFTTTLLFLAGSALGFVCTQLRRIADAAVVLDQVFPTQPTLLETLVIHACAPVVLMAPFMIAFILWTCRARICCRRKPARPPATTPLLTTSWQGSASGIDGSSRPAAHRRPSGKAPEVPPVRTGTNPWGHVAPPVNTSKSQTVIHSDLNTDPVNTNWWETGAYAPGTEIDGGLAAPPDGTTTWLSTGLQDPVQPIWHDSSREGFDAFDPTSSFAHPSTTYYQPANNTTGPLGVPGSSGDTQIEDPRATWYYDDTQYRPVTYKVV